MSIVLQKTIAVETNYRCNLRCIHCYVPDSEKRGGEILDVRLAASIFDQLRELGFRYVLLTGGEPLAHPEFFEIYRLAHERGLRTSLFTNALLLTARHLELFKRYPPALVRVSIFGGSAATCEAVAGADRFERAMSHLATLTAAGINLRVKMPLLVQNSRDVGAMRARLDALGISSKIDVRVIPRFDGDTEALAWRLTPEQIADIGLENPSRNLAQFDDIRRRTPPPPRSLRYCLEHCQPFLITPVGVLQLCFLYRAHGVALTDTPLREALDQLVAEFSAHAPDLDRSDCNGCEFTTFCTYCPGWAKLETGRAGNAIPFLCRLCELFHARYQQLHQSAV